MLNLSSYSKNSSKPVGLLPRGDSGPEPDANRTKSVVTTPTQNIGGGERRPRKPLFDELARRAVDWRRGVNQLSEKVGQYFASGSAEDGWVARLKIGAVGTQDILHSDLPPCVHEAGAEMIWDAATTSIAPAA